MLLNNDESDLDSDPSLLSRSGWLLLLQYQPGIT